MIKKLLITLIAAFIISYLLFSQIHTMFTPQPLSKSALQAQIKQLYAGELKSIIRNEQEAIISFSTKQGLYEVKIDLKNGNPSDLSLVHAFIKSEVVDSAPPNEPITKPTRLNEQEIIDIALAQQPGTIDHLSFSNTEDGGFYEIEIEHGEEETTFIIHALTGKILSVEFDDE